MDERQAKTLHQVTKLLRGQDSKESSVLNEIETLCNSSDHKNLCSELLKFFVHATFDEEESREEDIPCRYGGEEFVVILPETNIDGALKFATRLRSEMRADTFFQENRITFSGGISSYPESGESATKLLESADRALYQAKYSGKDRCTVDDLFRGRTT